MALTETFEELRRRAERHRGRQPDSGAGGLRPIDREVPVTLHRLTEPTPIVRHRFPVTRVDDAGGLVELLGLTMQELLWFADSTGLLRRAASGRLHHYSSRRIAASTGRARLLEAPRLRLRKIQRQILDELLTPVPVHPSAHGFARGRSAKGAAQQHVGAETLSSLDLESFFASITAGRIYGVFRSIGYPEPVAHRRSEPEMSLHG
jgi:hypothetical protein